MAYASQGKENSTPQKQQDSIKAAAQTFSDNRESSSATLQLQAVTASSPQQQKLKATAQLMANSPTQQRLNTTSQTFENKSQPLQRMEDEEPLQGKFETEEPTQLETAAEAPRPNNTGLPDNVKSGIENLSGINMDHVKVHYNSDKPAQLQAHAYAQGSEIHVAPGQEQHLPHEAWHVVQQAQGRVRPTVQMKGDVPVNDDVGLEREADLMGAQALGLGAVQIDKDENVGIIELTHTLQRQSTEPTTPATASSVIQKAAIDPATFFPGARGNDVVDADIAADEMSGFGTKVKGVDWHTQLTYGPLVQPGLATMHPEGSWVTGVIGPDHPYGSQPHANTARENNALAAGLDAGAPGHGNVAAHIVNDQVGGPGIAQNLFAFPSTANTLMETQVEGNMKTAIQAGNYIYYEATVHHPVNAPADYITMSWNKLDQDGADIGGGQANVRINANNIANNVVGIVQTGGTEAKNDRLINPTNATVIKGRPWGPFQMPDPKQIIPLGVFLDYTAFPAVGNARAFEEFLKNNKANLIQIELMFLDFSEALDVLKELHIWIKRGSGITIRDRGRGITTPMLNDLKASAMKAPGAFQSMLDTGEGSKIIDWVAKDFAKKARKTASARLM